MDIIADAVTQFDKLYEVLGPMVDQMSKDEVQSFSEINKLLKELKELVSKPGSSPLITLEFLSQKFILFKSVLHKQLAPLSQLSSFLLTNSPPVVIGVQWGERKYIVK